MKWTKQDWFIILGLFFFVLLLRSPSVAQPFENDSSSIAYHARLITQGKVLYGEHQPTHHMPGTYYVYATAFKVFGDNPTAVKQVLIGWIWLTAVMIYLVGRQIYGRTLGLFASGVYCFMSGNILLAGTNSKIESWVSLWQITAVYLLLRYRTHQDPRIFTVFGLFASLTVIFKANYLSPVALVGFLLIVQLVQDRQWRPVVMRGLWFSASFLGCLGLTFLFFTLSDALQGFLDVFRLGFSYVQIETQERPIPLMTLFYPLALLGQVNVIVVVGSLTAVVVYFRQLPRTYQDEPYLPAMTYIIVWFVLGFIETGVSRIFLNNYYLVFIPPMALLTGWVLLKISEAIPPQWGKIALFAICATMLVWWGLRGVQGEHYYHYYVSYVFGEDTYDDFLLKGLPEGVGETMLVLREIADYLQTNTTPDQTIYNWSPFVQIYYMSERQSAQEIIWALYVDALSPKEDIFTAEYIIIGSELPLGMGDSVPQWLVNELEANYTLETEIHGQKLYRQRP